ncbi:hypothetical protein [Colwellia psychrerythraea]|uniref:Uncharacterized protein n=1 Tax=Colwellia psychrerythraea TaxID=28229 RepID=A0A099K6H5_COLPS|nr:hypothetical protein [Colwellia psychrerythraea]KGJ86414.1 hypothetical protein ND2E_0980 [Colwellia psychrerythraea]
MSSKNKKNSQRKLAWDWIVTQSTFTNRQLRIAVGIPHHIAYQLTLFLIEKKRLKKTYKGKGAAGHEYELIDPSPMRFGTGNIKGHRYTKGRKNSAKQKCWNTMRVLGVFTIGDVSAGAEVATCTSSRYIRKLMLANFIRCIQKDSRGCEHSVAVFRLLHNSGPLYPITSDEGVFDQNTQKQHSYQCLQGTSLNGSLQKEPQHGKQKLA